MSNPLIRTRRVFAAKIEATPGTAVSPVSADSEFNAFNSMIQGNIEMHQRDNPNGFGSLDAIPGASAGSCTFQTELYGDGSGGVPFWADRLLPACGYIKTGNIFKPKSAGPGPAADEPKTLSIVTYQDGRKKLLYGAAGTFKITFNQGKPIMFDWNFSGIFGTPIDEAMITPVYPTQRPIRFANVNLLIGGSAPGCINAMEIDAGNEVVLRACANEESAIESATVVDGKPKATMDPESRLVTTDNTFNKWLSGSTETFSLTASNGTDQVIFSGPKFQRTNIQEADRNKIEVDQTTAQFNVSSGDDSLAIEFAAAP